MGIYIFLLAWIMVCSISAFFRVNINGIEISKKSVYLFLAMVPLTLVMGLRSASVGTDTSHYVNALPALFSSYDVLDVVNVVSGDYLYYMMVYVGGYISQSEHFYIFVESFIIMAGITYFIYKASPNVYFSTFLFFTMYYGWTMNNNRQAISIIIMLTAFLCLRDNLKSIKGWILFIISCCFHVSSICFVWVIIGMVWVRTGISINKIALCTLGLSILVSTSVYELLFKISPYLPDRYLSYFASDNQYNLLIEGGTEPNYGLVFVFGSILFLYIVLININKMAYKEAWMREIFPALLFFVIFFGIFQGNELTVRLMRAIEMLFIIFIPATLDFLQDWKRMLVYIIASCGLIVYVFFLWTHGTHGIVPYTSPFF